MADFVEHRLHFALDCTSPVRRQYGTRTLKIYKEIQQVGNKVRETEGNWLIIREAALCRNKRKPDIPSHSSNKDPRSCLEKVLRNQGGSPISNTANQFPVTAS